MQIEKGKLGECGRNSLTPRTCVHLGNMGPGGVEAGLVRYVLNIHLKQKSLPLSPLLKQTKH